MEGFEGIVALALAVLGLMALRSLPGMVGWRDSDAAMSAVAQKLGLRPPASDATRRVLLEGVVEGYRLTLESAAAASRLRVVVDGGAGTPRVWRRGAQRREAETVRPSQARVGGLVRLLAQIVRPGPVCPIVASFGAKEREEIVVDLERHGVELREGSLTREVDSTVSGRELTRRIRDTVALVDTLIQRIRPACERALASSDPGTRLAAACILENVGLPTLRALAADDAAPASVVIEALRNLSIADDREALTAALMHAVAGRKDEVRIFAIEALGEMKHGPAVGALVALVGAPDSATVEAAARSLGAIGDVGAEPALIVALTAESAEVQVAAAQALGVVGTATAVEPLLEAARKSWLPTHLDKIVREAVRRIQARAPGADTGQLSLADAGSARGALSVAVESETADGALSLAEASEREPLAAASQDDHERAAMRSPPAAKRPRDRQGG